MATTMIQPATKDDLEKLLFDSRIRNTDKQGNLTKWAIRSHGAKGPIFLHFVHDLYVIMDYKDAGYPNKGFANASCGLGGNYTFKHQEYPEDLLVKEAKEEVGKRFQSILRHEAFGEYFGVYPEEAHGNPKIGLYLNPVSWFVMHANGFAAADVLGIPRDKVSLEALQKAVPPITEFKNATVFSLNEVRHGRLREGSHRFAWGDDRLLNETISTLFDFDPQIPANKDIQMYRQMDVRLNQPFSMRWTIQHDYTSEGGTRQTDDAHVFQGGVAKKA